MAAAALALASTLGDGPDHAAVEYRDAALRGFRHLQRHGLGYLDDGRENIIDDTCALLAAVELASAFGDDVPDRSDVGARGACDRVSSGRRRETDGHVWLAADDGERSWFHASDEGLPGLALLLLAEYESRPRRAQRASSLPNSSASRLALDASRSNPFGYPRHWIKLAGSSPARSGSFRTTTSRATGGRARTPESASLATLLLAAAEAMPDRDWAPTARDAADSHVSWILGRNPFDVCMLQGYGRNNPPYHPGFHNAPGGVCNGITSGFDDEVRHRLPPDAVGGRQGTQLALGRAVDATRSMADARARARHRHRSPRCLTARQRWDMNVT